MDPTAALVLATHLAATAAMVGLIWFVQIVHYPLFALVGTAEFPRYEAAHTRSTSFVVGPAMAVEGISALAIAAWFRTEASTAAWSARTGSARSAGRFAESSRWR